MVYFWKGVMEYRERADCELKTKGQRPTQAESSLYSMQPTPKYTLRIKVPFVQGLN